MDEGVVFKDVELGSMQGFPDKSVKTAWVRSQIPLRINAIGDSNGSSCQHLSPFGLLWQSWICSLKTKKYIISHILDLKCPTLKPDRFNFHEGSLTPRLLEGDSVIVSFCREVSFPGETCLFYKVTQTFMKALSPWSNHLPQTYLGDLISAYEFWWTQTCSLWHLGNESPSCTLIRFHMALNIMNKCIAEREPSTLCVILMIELVLP